MKAPSERHLEDWIVTHPLLFGDFWDTDHALPIENRPYPRIEYHDGSYISPYFKTVIARQLTLPTGRLDLLCKTSQHLVVVEIKSGAITYKSIGQCLRYINDLRHVFYCVHSDISLQEDRMDYWYERISDLGNSTFPSDEIIGMVVGDSFEDENIPLVCQTCGIMPVLYDYRGHDYGFTEVCVEPRAEMSVYEEYGYGAVGEAIRGIMKARADHQKVWRARLYE